MNRTMKLTIARRESYADAEVVDGLRCHNAKMEEWFYKVAHSYFDRHFNDVFFDKDRKQEIFQSAFLKIWIEIDNGTIAVTPYGKVVRKRRNGDVVPMTCSLTTFLMAFAKNEYRELVRTDKLDYCGDIYEAALNVEPYMMYGDDSIDNVKQRIVDDCIQRVSPQCIEILTMFYYEQKTLDEILIARGGRHTSKNGLKTAKNKCMNTLRNLCNEEFVRMSL